MIRFSEYKINEKLDVSRRDYNNILKKMGVMNQNGNVDLVNMTQKINGFLNTNDNKNKFLKDITEEVKGEKTKIKVNKLKPGQSEIFLDQVIERILSDDKFTKDCIKGKLKDRDILISSDNYIIDGHHRCVGSFILNPDCKIKCTKINLPAEIAIPILNGILKVTNSESQAEKGKQEYNIYTLIKDNDFKLNLLNIIQKVAKDLWNKKKRGKKIEKLFSRIYEIDKDKKSPTTYLSKNINKLPNPDNDLADRDDMPQLKDKVEKIID